MYSKKLISTAFGVSAISRLFYDNISKKWQTLGYCHLFKLKLVPYQFSSSFHNTTRKDGESRVSEETPKRMNFAEGPGLADFISSSGNDLSCEERIEVENVPYLNNIHGQKRKVYFDILGCQMNTNDAEVVWSILKSTGYSKTDSIDNADIILMFTCAIRDSAEEKVWNKLENYRGLNQKKIRRLSPKPIKVCVLGCMAERLKHSILEKNKVVDVIAGPDSYKDLPRLLAVSDTEAAVNVILSFDETYADITPVRMDPDAASAFVTIMRGCDNMCTYCIVPFTRGRERSRPVTSILHEVEHLSSQGVKEVTLLGQNVNSYRDLSELNFYPAEKNTATNLAKGFKTVYKAKKGGLRFSDLLDKVSNINPEMRIRFTSPHPKDFPDEVLRLIAERPNICKQIHLPAQSGNSEVLERMRRGYTRESYLDLVQHIRSIIPNVSLTSDFIAGFCGETEEQFQDTLSLMETVKYNTAFLFMYSMREKTTAHRRYQDDVPLDVKRDRLNRMIALYRKEVEQLNKAEIGEQHIVLVQGTSKRSQEELQGRNDGGTKVIIPNLPTPIGPCSQETRKLSVGDYVAVEINNANSQVLLGTPLYHTTMSDYYSLTQENASEKIKNKIQ